MCVIVVTVPSVRSYPHLLSLHYHEGYNGTTNELNCSYSSFCQSSFPVTTTLHYSKGYLKPLRCLNAAMTPSVYVPIPFYFALLKRILGMLNVPNYHYSPVLLSGIPSSLTEFCYHRRYKRPLMCLEAAMVSSVNLGSCPHLTSFCIIAKGTWDC